ncbi:putative outer membrane protein [Pedobacter sp. BAL39]|uniref:TonB-dependent receptor n=1 Tax=Pedobacter sp. BAL39 TaxID=391596 RepID=UPI0001559AA1|nr:TonB-dependent receptor [Pedobacter sp. BAL39]EDM37763.1 putative outer membrane protein [Pedobacter sp. BAL39]
MTVFFLNASAFVKAQKITYIRNGTTVSQVFKEIKKQTGYNVFWPSEKFDAERKVSVSFSQSSLDDVLRYLLRDRALSYDIKAQTIVIFAAKPESTSQVQSADTLKVITGKVTDIKGAALPGIGIKYKEGNIATTTNGEGQYTIKVPNRGSLIFSYIGFASQEILVAGKQVVNVQMIEKQEDLTEVVVVGYGTQKRKDLISAVSSIKGKDLENLPVATPQSLIQGRASGVQVVQNSGAPGSAVTVRIRGTTSINAGNDPLYIVDGIPVESGSLNSISLSGSQTSALSAISSDDIESMEILKDAGALAIYGSRAANGVVLITTKHGKKGITSYNFNYYTGFQKDNKGSRIKLMDNQQSIDLIQEGRANALADGVTSVYGFLLPAPDGTTYNTNWQDALFRTAPISNYEFSVRGGENKLRFALSGSYLDQDGIIIASGYKRGTGRINLDYDATEKLKFGTNFSLSRYTNNRVPTEDGALSVLQVALKKSPSMPIYNADGSYFNNDVSGFINPVAFASKIKYQNEVSSLIGNLYGQYDILSGLNIRSTVGLNYASVVDQYFQPSDAMRNGVASGQAFSSRVDGWINENTLNYSKQLGKHNLSGVLGYSQQQRSSFAINAAGTQFASNNISTLNAAGLPTTASSSNSSYGLSSAFARIGYAYADKYLLEATARRDGSSRFGENQKYAVFPALSAAWRISNEEFWDKTGIVNDFKIRGSLGKTGNQTIGDYTAQGQYTTGAGYLGQSGIYLNILPNPDLTWETTLQYNAGLDLSLWNSRVTLNVDAYVKNTSNLLLNVPLPNSSGFGSVLRNIGSTQNKGLEFGLNTINIETDALSWSSNFNISFNRNKVTKLYGDDGNIINGSGQGLSGSLVSYSILEVGQPIGSFFGWRHSGVYSNSTDNTAQIRNASVGTNNYLFKGGDLIFQDLNNNGVIDNEDRSIIGNAQPKFTGGFTNNLKYKSFDLNILMTFSYGNDILNGTRYAAESATGFVGAKSLLNRWRNEGDVTDIPKVNYADPAGNRRFSNRWLEDGSYLRAKTVTLGYQLPKSLIAKASMKTCRVYVSAQNLFTITNYTGYDPEASSFNSQVTQIGIDQGTYPQYRAVTFGASVGF